MCKEIQKLDIHLFAAAEHNLDTNKFAVRQELQNIACQSYTQHWLQTLTSTTKANKLYKPGGMLLPVQGNMVGRIKDPGSNPLGRWMWVKLEGHTLTRSSLSYLPIRFVSNPPTIPVQQHTTSKRAFYASKVLRRQIHDIIFTKI
jgi:hypothetical protein